MKSKKAAMGEGVFMMYLLTIITLSALVILGISTFFYSHYIDVRPAESIIMNRQVADCFTKENINLTEIEKGKVLSFCGYEESETERFFIKVDLLDSSNKIMGSFYQGDSGKIWVKELYDKQKEKTESIKKYTPGYYVADYPFFDKENGRELIMRVEVLVNEF